MVFPFSKLKIYFLCLAGFLFILLNGCASFLPLPPWSSEDFEPLGTKIATVPFYDQQGENDCGPAALAMVLNWSDVSTDPDMLSPMLLSPEEKGTLQLSMIAGARRFGRVAYTLSQPEDLYPELAAGHPVIALQNLGFSWWPKWHYSTVVGYDLPNRQLILHSGSQIFKKTSIGVFNSTWKSSNYWGLLVLPPSELPATATESRYISSVANLEQAGHWQSAAIAYKASLKKWPDSIAARIGLSNTYCAMQDFDSAEDILRNALEINPSDGVVLNNLAHVLWKKGENREAAWYALMAIHSGGPHVDEFRKTYLDIISSQP
jgi:tetratricopeptide (TPR) repeat protein